MYKDRQGVEPAEVYGLLAITFNQSISTKIHIVHAVIHYKSSSLLSGRGGSLLATSGGGDSGRGFFE